MRCVAPGDPVLSNRNQVETTVKETMTVVVASIAENLGFSLASSGSLEVLTDIAARHLEKSCLKLNILVGHAGRSRPILSDVETLFDHILKLSEEDLLDYVKQCGSIKVKGLQLPRLVPLERRSVVGIGRNLELVTPLPAGMGLLLERPDHIPEWAPPILTGEMTQEAFEERFASFSSRDRVKREFLEKKSIPFPDFSEATVDSLHLQEYINKRLVIITFPLLPESNAEEFPQSVVHSSNDVAPEPSVSMGERALIMRTAESDEEQGEKPFYSIETVEQNQWEIGGKIGLTKSGRISTSQFATVTERKIPVLKLKILKPETPPLVSSQQTIAPIDDPLILPSPTPSSVKLNLLSGKRPRGRPKKIVEEEIVMEEIPITPLVPLTLEEPLLNVTPPLTPVSSSNVLTTPLSLPTKRPLGRPSKSQPQTEVAKPKRGRGRPPKSVISRGSFKRRVITPPTLSTPLGRRSVGRPKRFLDGLDVVESAPSVSRVNSVTPLSIPKASHLARGVNKKNITQSHGYPMTPLTLTIPKLSLLSSNREKKTIHIVEEFIDFKKDPTSGSGSPMIESPTPVVAPLRLKIPIGDIRSENLEEPQIIGDELGEKRKHRKGKKHKKEKKKKRDRIEEEPQFRNDETVLSSVDGVIMPAEDQMEMN